MEESANTFLVAGLMSVSGFREIYTDQTPITVRILGCQCRRLLNMRWTVGTHRTRRWSREREEQRRATICCRLSSSARPSTDALVNGPIIFTTGNIPGSGPQSEY